MTPSGEQPRRHRGRDGSILATSPPAPSPRGRRLTADLRLDFTEHAPVVPASPTRCMARAPTGRDRQRGDSPGATTSHLRPRRQPRLRERLRPARRPRARDLPTIPSVAATPDAITGVKRRAATRGSCARRTDFSALRAPLARSASTGRGVRAAAALRRPVRRLARSGSAASRRAACSPLPEVDLDRRTASARAHVMIDALAREAPALSSSSPSAGCGRSAPSPALAADPARPAALSAVTQRLRRGAAHLRDRRDRRPGPDRARHRRDPRRPRRRSRPPGHRYPTARALLAGEEGDPGAVVPHALIRVDASGEDRRRRSATPRRLLGQQTRRRRGRHRRRRQGLDRHPARMGRRPGAR